MAKPSRGAGHTLAGFTVGIVAAAVGLLFARPADQEQPLNEAARYAGTLREQVAALPELLRPRVLTGPLDEAAATFKSDVVPDYSE